MLRAALVVVTLTVLGVAWLGLADSAAPSPHAAPAQARGRTTTPTGPSQALPPSAAASPLRFIAIGGGATPESTEVSLEQNLALAARVLPGPGRLLFAGGADTQSVRVLDPALDASSVPVRVGELFSPRNGRGSRYRKPTLAAAAATLAEIRRELGQALSGEGDPLVVYVASHGEQGETARDNHVVLWGADVLSVAELAVLSEQPKRPVRFVITSCFSGGFAELAFEGADEKRGATRASRCGLFAGTWDRETSGCDPNPDRRAQESYSIHLLHALRGEDREGKPLPKREVDFDGDGRVSLLEAHTRARIAAVSIDVPTSTSERYLRHAQSAGHEPEPGLLPEEAALVTQLGARLGLLTHAAAQAQSERIAQKLETLDRELTAAEARLDEAHAALSIVLLGRWPVLDDAYHPDFQATVARDGAAIARVLDTSEQAKAYFDALDRVDELDARYAAAQGDDAVLSRLLRAHETLELAAGLKARGGSAWRQYAKLLACERATVQ